MAAASTITVASPSLAPLCNGDGAVSAAILKAEKAAAATNAAVDDPDDIALIRDFSTEFGRSLSIEDPTASDDAAASCTSPTAVGDTCTKNRYVTPKDFELLKVIGMGSFGKVLQVRNRHTGCICAMKVISKRLLRRGASYVQNVLAERDILTKIGQHPFIVTMDCSFQTREKLFIVMDFLAGGELFLKLGREGIFREKTAAFYLAEITLALEHLHVMNVLHRDLKPENILLGTDGHCCLTDFGLAKDFEGREAVSGGGAGAGAGAGGGAGEDKKENGEGNNNDNDKNNDGGGDEHRAKTLCGTMEYMAPEMVARKWYGKGADFWSLGCIAYEMLSGEPPFSNKTKTGRNGGSRELFRKIINDRVKMPEGSSASACKLLKGLLNRDASKRLGASKGTMFEVGGVGALKKQPFFEGLDWGKLELKEIDPPEQFGVDDEHDLRHFHDEFVKMDLPRSVREMSKLDFQPRRCESGNFRGFSFIGDQFQLPERTASEQEQYWTNVDGDGQSLSECASSVFDDDFSIDSSAPPSTTPASPAPGGAVGVAASGVDSEKKKRPPRKKKKKNQGGVNGGGSCGNVPPMETTAEEAKDIDKGGVENGDGETAKRESDLKKTSSTSEEATKKESKMSKSGHASPWAKPATGGEKLNLSTPTTRPIIGSGVSTIPSNGKGGAKATTTTAKLDPQARVWEIKRTTAPAPQAALTPTPTNTVPVAIGKTTAVPPQPRKAACPPTPGSWASMTVGSKGAAPSTPVRSSVRPSVPAAPAPSTPTHDWRNHVVPPRRKLASPVVGAGITPSPISQRRQPQSTITPPKQVWPGLGDFPSPLGGIGRGMQPSPLPIKKATMGAWGAKR